MKDLIEKSFEFDRQREDNIHFAGTGSYSADKYAGEEDDQLGDSYPDEGNRLSEEEGQLKDELKTENIENVSAELPTSTSEVYQDQEELGGVKDLIEKSFEFDRQREDNIHFAGTGSYSADKYAGEEDNQLGDSYSDEVNRLSEEEDQIEDELNAENKENVSAELLTDRDNKSLSSENIDKSREELISNQNEDDYSNEISAIEDQIEDDFITDDIENISAELPTSTSEVYQNQEELGGVKDLIEKSFEFDRQREDNIHFAGTDSYSGGEYASEEDQIEDELNTENKENVSAELLTDIDNQSLASENIEKSREELTSNQNEDDYSNEISAIEDQIEDELNTENKENVSAELPTSTSDQLPSDVESRTSEVYQDQDLEDQEEFSDLKGLIEKSFDDDRAMENRVHFIDSHVDNDYRSEDEKVVENTPDEYINEEEDKYPNNFAEEILMQNKLLNYQKNRLEEEKEEVNELIWQLKSTLALDSLDTTQNIDITSNEVEDEIPLDSHEATFLSMHSEDSISPDRESEGGDDLEHSKVTNSLDRNENTLSFDRESEGGGGDLEHSKVTNSLDRSENSLSFESNELLEDKIKDKRTNVEIFKKSAELVTDRYAINDRGKAEKPQQSITKVDSDSTNSLVDQISLRDSKHEHSTTLE